MERIKSIDLARGFTVLFIPIIHSVMLYSEPTVHESGFGKTLAFIAEWPGAQVFMLLMGISIALTKQTSFMKVLLRSCLLLGAGYLLNAIKFLVPYFMVGLPERFLNDIGVYDWRSLLLIGDIFHFAALALIALYFVKILPEYPLIAALLAFFICFASPDLWDMYSDHVISNHLLELLSSEPSKVFFPFFPWVVYPLTGLFVGYFIKLNGSKTLTVLFPVGFSLMLSSFCADGMPVENFYRAGPWETVMHLGFVLSWISLWHFASYFISNNQVFDFLSFLSKRITLIYIIQWPVIFWLLPVVGYQQLNLISSIVTATVVSGVVFIAAFYFTQRRKGNKSQS